MPKQVKNIGASVRARLLKLAHQSKQAPDLVMVRYAIERLLYRLSISQHRDRFVLKGAMLMTTWFEDPHRPTRDVDFLGYGDPSPEPMLEAFREVCAIDEPDGVVFDVKALRVEQIREHLEYGGLRLVTTADLAGARLKVGIDIGFGDAVEPGVEDIVLPVLLDLPAPNIRAYARETVLAEKFQAMVALGLLNSRMKDFYDVWMLSRAFVFDEERLARALAATFARRGTPLPVDPSKALPEGFSTHPIKQQQWSAFSHNLADVPSLEVVVADVLAFLMPYVEKARAR